MLLSGQVSFGQRVSKLWTHQGDRDYRRLYPVPPSHHIYPVHLKSGWNLVDSSGEKVDEGVYE